MLKVLEFVAAILTIVGFFITIWQLISFKTKLKESAAVALKTQRQLIHLAKVTDAIRLVELIQEHLMASELRIALYRSQELGKVLNEINDEEAVKDNVRSNYNRVRISFAERLESLQNAVASGGHYDNRFMLSTLQSISDNLQLVQKQLKK